MPGVKGKSGGLRPGAGRPPQSFRLKLGDELLFNEQHPDGSTGLQSARVTDITRTKITLTVEADGRPYRIVLIR